jgi:ATP-dependent Clp protease ATP-binding subunit ClpA
MHFFNDNVNKILVDAAILSKELRQKYITLTAIYFCTTKSENIQKILKKSGVNVDKLQKTLKSKIEKQADKNQIVDNEQPHLSSIVESFFKLCEKDAAYRKDYINDKKIDEKFYRADESIFLISILMNSLFEPNDEMHEIFETTLKHSTEKELTKMMEKIISNSMKYVHSDLTGYVRELMEKRSQLAANSINRDYEEFGSTSEMTQYSDEVESDKNSPLNTYADNMNKLYSEGELEESIIGRDEELKDIIKILSKKKKSNPILVGSEGVGKTVIVDALVGLIMSEKPPKSLKGKIIYRLDLTRLVAGTKYRGDFEARMSALLAELKANKDVILWVDEIHAMLSAGSTGTNGADVSGILKPALANGSIKCIGATTFDEYKQIFSKDAALNRRFQKVFIKEPSLEDMKQIIVTAKTTYEEHHKITYTEDALEGILKLSDRYLHSARFPDKAMDILDQSGALYSSGEKRGNVVTLTDVINIISVRANIDLSKQSNTLKQLKNLDSKLSKSVFGQEKAIETLVDAVHVAKAGLNNHNKPYGSFLFLGPTGVGKTEVVNVLQSALSMKLHRFDMSEYMEKHSVSKLFGAPPGYIGSGKGGLLTEVVDREPYSIILFDEIEKAHADIFNSLLQVLDNGKMTDGDGKTVSFRNTIIVFTSNIGVRESQDEREVGFGATLNKNDIEDVSFEINEQMLNAKFSPEFRNRLSGIVPFNYLTEKTVVKVVTKFISELQKSLDEKNVSLKMTTGAKKLLANKGYDRKMGARPMERIINDRLKKPLSKEILFGDLKDGGTVSITSKNDDFVISVN